MTDIILPDPFPQVPPKERPVKKRKGQPAPNNEALRRIKEIDEELARLQRRMNELERKRRGYLYGERWQK